MIWEFRYDPVARRRSTFIDVGDSLPPNERGERDDGGMYDVADVDADRLPGVKTWLLHGKAHDAEVAAARGHHQRNLSAGSYWTRVRLAERVLGDVFSANEIHRFATTIGDRRARNTWGPKTCGFWQPSLEPESRFKRYGRPSRKLVE